MNIALNSDLAGFVHRGRDNEGTVPVEMHTTDFSPVPYQSVYSPSMTHTNQYINV